MELTLQSASCVAGCLLLAAVFRRRRLQSMRSRSCSIRPYFQRRMQKGAFRSDIVEMRRLNKTLHFHYVRFSPALFDKLLQLIDPFLTRRCAMTSRIRAPITNAEKLAVTLRYLASGQSMRDVSIQFRLGHTTTHKIILEVCQAIWNGLAGRYVKCPSSPAEWAAVAQEFCQRWNFPNCLGAIDGKHINIQAPHNTGSSFYNYKNFHSIVLLAVVDAHYRFLVVDIGCSGRDSDGGIFASSKFGQALESATANVPQPSNSIPGLGTFPYCLVGDAAFPLRSYLMRPYPGKQLSTEKKIFNYRLSR